MITDFCARPTARWYTSYWLCRSGILDQGGSGVSLRFAFYGRVSTEDAQDPEASRSWQKRRALDLITPHGGVLAVDYFDVDQSRSLPWKRRPEASRLLSDVSSSRRDFDAVVIGEPARAFYGPQFALTFPVPTHYGVGLWVPEVGGAVDPGSEAHDLVMTLFGGMSKGSALEYRCGSVRRCQHSRRTRTDISVVDRLAVIGSSMAAPPEPCQGKSWAAASPPRTRPCNIFGGRAGLPHVCRRHGSALHRATAHRRWCAATEPV